jgi:hypothetical protein
VNWAIAAATMRANRMMSTSRVKGRTVPRLAGAFPAA